MRFTSAILILLAFSSLICCCPAAGSEYIHINDVTMRLEGENATFDLNYTLDTFSQIYVMVLGCRYLEPELRFFLGCYKDVQLIRADYEGATLHVRGAGRYNSGYYLFDSTSFNCNESSPAEGISRFSVVYPGGRVRTFYNVTSTQNVFSEAERS
jgi:hypothetical protein